jgi:uncharacterized protein (PEP-CTERM system associated)
LLDRLEHLIHLDGRYQFCPTLVGLVGYSFRLATYTGDELLFPGSNLKSDDRDYYSHYLYAGVDYDLSTKLRATVRLGGQFTDYAEANESQVSPYADASLTYLFCPRSSVAVGVRHDRHATDVVSPDAGGNPTLDAEATVVYLTLTHQITSKLVGSLMGQYQTSEFNDGRNDGGVEDLFLMGANLSYSFSRHFSGEAGYNYDFLSSDAPGRDYHRSRVYLGLRAAY